MAAPVDWQLECKEVKKRGAHLLQTGQWSDCSFLVGSEPHQVVVNGHKLILAMASPVFEAMFFGGIAERDAPIPILDVQPEAFKALLEYIYTDNINISSFDKACELCYGAKKYMLPHLVEECTRYLWSDLYPRNACRAYEFARLFEENILMEKCLQIISMHTKEVLTDSSFEEVDLKTVITVFTLDHLNIDSELDLFEAAARYAKAQEKRSSDGCSTPCQDVRKSPEPSTSKEKLVVNVVNIESSAENSPAPESCKAMEQEPPVPSPNPEPVKDVSIKADTKDKPTIRSAIEKIRFLTLTPQQFAEGPARSPLLTERESFAVLMNILSSNSDVPMPTGFSTCRVPRRQLFGPLCGSSNMPTYNVDTPSPVKADQVFGAEANRPSNSMAFMSSATNSNNWPSSILQYPPRPSRALEPGCSGHGPLEPRERLGSDITRLYCQRALMQHTECLNTSVLDCCLSFMVDKNICLIGIQVPTQSSSEEISGSTASSLSSAGSSGYSELLYAHLLDADGARLTYTHYTNRVPFRRLLDICFNRPVYIQRNKVYKVGVVFNKVGWYPMGTCAQQVNAESVFFNFCVGQSGDSVRDGLIRSIIFSC